jgi:general secretion pathway protein G
MLLTQIASAMDTYKLNIGNYPSKDEGGLKALLVKPGYADPSLAGKWQGPYLRPGTRLQDAWGHDFVYACPGEHNPNSYDLMSKGPDGRVGGGDDIANY